MLEIFSKQFFKRGEGNDNPTAKKKKGKKIALKEQKKILRGFVKIETFKLGKKIRETKEKENMIMLGTDTGISLILERLIGTNTFSLNITHADLGMDNTPATLADTTLGNAQARAVRALPSISGADAEMSFFFPDALTPNGSYWEFGTFIDGTIAVDTGQIFNHLVFDSAYVKASGEDTTIKVRFTFA